MKNDRTLLQILKAVNYTQTISEVADKLYLSQPYISNIIKKAEATYQITLINRTKPISLTVAGHAMLNGLEIIISEEDRLTAKISTLTSTEKRTITIGITDPFLSSKVTQLTSMYDQNNQQFKLEVRLLADDSNVEDVRDLDIVVGQHLLDPNFVPVDLPMRLLYLFVPDSCDGYQPGQLFQKYSSSILRSLNTTTYIGLAGHASFQRYVENSFQKANLILTTKMLVPTPLDALYAMAITPNSTTITTLETAKQVFPKSNFNLIALPSNFIALDTTINVRRDTGKSVKDLANFLQDKLISHQDTASTPIIAS